MTAAQPRVPEALMVVAKVLAPQSAGSAASVVAVAALPVVEPELPVTLPEIGLVTVSPVKVPTLVIFV